MKRNELKQKYHKETLCYYKDQNGLINKEYMNWLEDELIRQLTLTDVGLHSELLLCGVCDVETWHDTSNKKELNCLKCGNVAKE